MGQVNRGTRLFPGSMLPYVSLLQDCIIIVVATHRQSSDAYIYIRSDHLSHLLLKICKYFVCRTEYWCFFYSIRKWSQQSYTHAFFLRCLVWNFELNSPQYYFDHIHSQHSIQIFDCWFTIAYSQKPCSNLRSIYFLLNHHHKKFNLILHRNMYCFFHYFRRLSVCFYKLKLATAVRLRALSVLVSTRDGDRFIVYVRCHEAR